MEKGTILYVGNFELPDIGASANRVMTNRLLFSGLGYRTAYLGITRGEAFSGIRATSFDADSFERAYPSSIRMWLARSYSLLDIIDFADRYEQVRFIIFYNAPVSLVKKAHRYFSKKNIGVLFDCTEWNAYTEGNLLKRMMKKWDAWKTRYLLESYVDGMIVISSLMYRSYTRKPKVLLPPLVNTGDAMWHREVTGDTDVFTFCYAGKPEKKDDLCCLIDAYIALNRENTRLIIIGAEKEAFLAAHPDYRYDESHMAGRVNFCGEVPHKEVIRHLLMTDCFVFIRESNLRNNAGFPTKFAEAFTSGAQMIATDVSDIGNYMDDGIYIIPDARVETITDAMRRAMEEKRGGLRELFDYRTYVKKVGSFLERVAEVGSEKCQ